MADRAISRKITLEGNSDGDTWMVESFEGPPPDGRERIVVVPESLKEKAVTLEQHGRVIEAMADMEGRAHKAEAALADRGKEIGTLRWIAERKCPEPHEGTGYAATLRQVIERARAVLDDSKPAPDLLGDEEDR